MSLYCTVQRAMFDLQTPEISYTIIEKLGTRRAKLRINRKGEVVVTVPARTPKMIVNRFVNQNMDWIVTQQAKLSIEKVLPDDQVYIFGKVYTAVVTSNPDTRVGCAITGDNLEINIAGSVKPLSHKEVQSTLSRFLRTVAAAYILKRTPQLADRMGIVYGKIQLREQKSRWGSCSSTGTLNFNWRLAHAPPAVVDYVIIHELAHRKEMNHSSRFWQIVAKYDPAYKQHQGWLKREGKWVFPESEAL